MTPLNNFFRTATRDATIADTQVRAGDRVILLYPSANRDESVFDDPYTFDIRRNPNPHVAFGFGTHFCLGASLARARAAHAVHAADAAGSRTCGCSPSPTSSRTSSSARCARAGSASTPADQRVSGYLAAAHAERVTGGIEHDDVVTRVSAADIRGSVAPASTAHATPASRSSTMMSRWIIICGSPATGGHTGGV